ncbi:MAG: diacylglycerol kinase family protein [Actinomycetota bacterium]|nr:diacylglycerol kinase family protein [Actinomycetota bacterium]
MSAAPEHPPPGPPGTSGTPGPLARFLRAFGFAGQGVWQVVRTERNMRVHLAVAAAVIVAGVLYRVSAVDWACLALAIGLVLTAETVNSALETLTDLHTSQHHPLAKTAKDAAAGAVLIASVAAVGVGAAVFWPRVFG